MAAAQGGLPALGPALQDAFGLTLVQVTGVFTAFGAGTVLTVYAWGALVDRVGERVVLAVGPALGGFALATSSSPTPTARCSRACSPPACSRRPRPAEAGVRCSVGSRAASAGSRSGCARRRCSSAPRPPRSRSRRWRLVSLDVALLALAGGLVASSVIAGIWLRDPPARKSAAPPAPPAARDPRIWRLGLASALLIVGQIGLTSLLVLYLYTERGWSATRRRLRARHRAARRRRARVIAGRWSDLHDERIAPFRQLAGGAGVFLLAAAALAAAPDAVLVPLLMARRRARDELERTVLHRRGRDLRRRAGGPRDGHAEHADAGDGRGGAGRAGHARRARLLAGRVPGDGAGAAGGASAARAARGRRGPAPARAPRAPQRAAGSRSRPRIPRGRARGTGAVGAAGERCATRRWRATCAARGFDSYDELWRWSVDDLEGFWGSIWDLRRRPVAGAGAGEHGHAGRRVVPGHAAELRRAALPRRRGRARRRSSTRPSRARWPSCPGTSWATRWRAARPVCAGSGWVAATGWRLHAERGRDGDRVPGDARASARSGRAARRSSACRRWSTASRRSSRRC